MGRKKKKTTKPWCWYCNREFEDDKILLQHQKAKHFKCHICHKKLFTGPGLQIHCMQVHKENIEKVPNSIKGRDDITLEICGMDNIPEQDLIDHEKQKTSASKDDDSDSDTETSLPHKPVANFQPPYPSVPPPHPPKTALPPTMVRPPIPGSNPMMQQMMMMYPHMAQMMTMNPMMMQQMMNMPPGMMPPQPPGAPPTQPPLPSQSQNQPAPPPPPPPQTSQAPKPLMSLMDVNPKLSPGHFLQDHSMNVGLKIPPQVHKPLFPAAADFTNDLNQVSAHLNDPHYILKIENAPPGSRIVHPENDISLEEFRASHHKYKYTAPQYSLTGLPNVRLPNPYSESIHTQVAPLFPNNGKGY